MKSVRCLIRNIHDWFCLISSWWMTGRSPFKGTIQMIGSLNIWLIDNYQNPFNAWFINQKSNLSRRQLANTDSFPHKLFQSLPNLNITFVSHDQISGVASLFTSAVASILSSHSFSRSLSCLIVTSTK